MPDDPPTASGALPDPPPPSEPPDIMNDAAFNPPQTERRDTLSSKASEGGSERVDTCRICRSEATPDEPLFYPCKCSGSIKFVHQECLMEWLSHSHKKHCELCKTPFRFTKLYDANMPQTLPWGVFVRTAFKHVGLTIWRAMRTLLVAFVWLGVVPWLIRWVWRWLFWMADAAWAREAFKEMVLKRHEQHLDQRSLSQRFSNAFQQFFRAQTASEPLASDFSDIVFKNVVFGSGNSTAANRFAWPQADPSILSSWSYLASLTPHSYLNRLILDVFEGQLITCVVITGFILVFLIREWVVQQQPLVNLDNPDPGDQQIRDAFARVQAAQEDLERQRHQEELLRLARRRLQELKNEREPIEAGEPEFMGWDRLEQLIDHATAHLRKGGTPDHAQFMTCAVAVTKQIRAAGRSDMSMEELTDKVVEKIAPYTEHERQEWVAVLVSELSEFGKDALLTTNQSSQSGSQNAEQSADWTQVERTMSPTRRPPMPGREISSRATQIHRQLADTEDTLRSAQDNRNEAPLSSTAAEPPSASVASVASTESWQEVTPPGGSTVLKPDAESSLKFEPVPITNAGPDAKINIRRSGKGRMKIVPAPKIEEKMMNDDEELVKLKDEVAKEAEAEERTAASNWSSAAQRDSASHTRGDDNPFRPDGPTPERRNSESFGNRVASVFREEFGLDEAEELENLRQNGLGHDGEPAPNDGQPEAATRRADDSPPTYLQRIGDWFWGDIQAPHVPEPVPTANEEREQPEGEEGAQVAPFVPVQNGQPVAAAPAQANAQDVQLDQQQNDPEVVAAAQQAGLDPEAVEDAEDLEGVLELIGLQGPMIGLFQTSAFCMLLVACTILGAVIVPYLGGKLVLSFIGNPVYFLFQMPLQVASTIADFLIDTTLMMGGWLVMLTALGADFTLSAAQTWAPSVGRINLTEKIMEYAAATATNSALRLQRLFAPSEPVEGLAWNWAFLGWSVHAHASLKQVQDEINAILSYTGAAVTWIVENISSGSLLAICKQSLDGAARIGELPAKMLAALDLIRQNVEPLIKYVSDLRRGALTFSTPEIPMDPSLVYWNSTDRSLAILAGYTALAGLAAVYVAMDTPITRSESGQKTEKMIRDSLRQAGGVLKVILIISIEMLVFPLYCGLLLDVAFLPLFQGANVASRWAYAGRKPYAFCFVHWFVGTCYMFHFALFVGMCRKILRKGVLWFIRDPDDPTFHPVRDVLERNVATQLRKIAFSALVYGALVILCLGGVIWTIGRAFERIFPIHWTSIEPILEFPLDLFLFNFVAPLILRLVRPSDAVNAMYAWWLRQCARQLRLSHFLFDDRRKDEEGHVVHKSWAGFLSLKRPSISGSTECGEHGISNGGEEAEVSFKQDGKYVLTPCNDQYRPPKPGEAFLHADENDVYIADKAGKKNDHFAKVYVPPLFRFRITLFMICLWMISAFTGLCATLLPLVLGRYLLAKQIPEGSRMNDVYAYAVGALILGGALFATLKGKSTMVCLKDKASAVNMKAWIEPLKRFGAKALKCTYVYGFLGVVLPTVFALVLQFYLILPLHTWAVSSMEANTVTRQSANATTSSLNITDSAPLFSTQTLQPKDQQLPSLAEHTFHILQDYVVGLVYVRIASRLVIAAPASRAAEAFRRITADGYLNPNARLASRFFVLPVTLVSALVLLFPPLLAYVAITTGNAMSGAHFDAETRTKIYRYSYPIAASLIMLVLGTAELGKATRRWRARIRDEVYLVGERLHNFGEKKPPAGTKTVVRKET